MYDAVFVLVEAFNKMLRKKPDTFRGSVKRGGPTNGSRGLDCNTTRGWEHGDKISRVLRKVRLKSDKIVRSRRSEDVSRLGVL